MSQAGGDAGRAFAHTPNVGGSWHLLSDHLRGTGELAAEFAHRFGGDDLARTAGWLHDVGKCSCAFSAYLQTCDASGDEEAKRAYPRRDHKRAGAVLANERGHSVRILLAATILGHHGGLSDLGDVRAQLSAAVRDPEVMADLSRRARAADPDAQSSAEESAVRDRLADVTGHRRPKPAVTEWTAMRVRIFWPSKTPSVVVKKVVNRESHRSGRNGTLVRDLF